MKTEVCIKIGVKRKHITQGQPRNSNYLLEPTLRAGASRFERRSIIREMDQQAA